MSTATEACRERPVVLVRGAAKAYVHRSLFSQLDLELRAGQVLAIVGPSGAGKTSVLRCLAGLLPLDAGTVAIRGTVLARRRDFYSFNPFAPQPAYPPLGYVPQGIDLWPDRSLLANVALARRHVLKVRPESAEQYAQTLLQRFGLASKATAYPDLLSGGEQQRGALCRALAVEPVLLLLDEITSALDPEHVSDVLDCIRDLAGERRTMILVTHHLAFARSIADAFLFLDGMGGHSLSEGQAFFTNPPSKRAAVFLESCRKLTF